MVKIKLVINNVYIYIYTHIYRNIVCSLMNLNSM